MATTRDNVEPHLFDGALDGGGFCKNCGQSYEPDTDLHNFGKVWRIDGDEVILRPYVQADYDREIAYAARAPFSGSR